MTAERSLYDTLWNRLPTFVKNTILDNVSKGRFKCTIPNETLRNVDIMDMNGALRYLGYNIHRKNHEDDWTISWDAGYRDRF